MSKPKPPQTPDPHAETIAMLDRKYSKLLTRKIAGLGMCQGDAKGVFQDCLLKIHEKLRNPDPRKPIRDPERYLKGMWYNMAIEFFRRRKRRNHVPFEEGRGVQDCVDAFWQQKFANEDPRRFAAAKALRRLSPSDLNLLIARRIERVPLKILAESLGITVYGVSIRTRRIERSILEEVKIHLNRRKQHPPHAL